MSAENTESTDTAAEGGTIKVAASATPHAEILEEAKKILADEGWNLEIKIFDDYVMPNEVVESGEFDANYSSTFRTLRALTKRREPIWSMQAASTMSRSAFIPEQSPISPSWLTATPSQCRTIPQTRREHFFCYRITASLP